MHFVMLVFKGNSYTILPIATKFVYVFIDSMRMAGISYGHHPSQINPPTEVNVKHNDFCTLFLHFKFYSVYNHF